MNTKQMALENIIFEGLSGSYAYGTNIEGSDKDIRGLFVADKIHRITPFFNVDQIDSFDTEDKVIYEVSKFMKLLVDMNPNILELLWIDASDIIKRTFYYDILRGNRDLLLSSKVKFTFSGYAHSQLKRIKGHNKWINNPIEEKPRQIDFVKCVHSLNSFFKKSEFDTVVKRKGHKLVILEGNVLGLYVIKDAWAFNQDDGSLNIHNDDNDATLRTLRAPIFIVRFNKEEYKHQLDRYNKYQSWKKNRNKDRSSLEYKYGYDTKHAMHLIRLYRMGIEILEEQEVRVKRPDAKDLLEIRNGKYTYDELMEYVQTLDTRLNYAYKNTSLRKSVDLQKAAEILSEVYRLFW